MTEAEFEACLEQDRREGAELCILRVRGAFIAIRRLEGTEVVCDHGVRIPLS